MSNKNITPNEVNELLKAKGARTPSHYRDGATKTERSVASVVNAASKTRAMISTSIYDSTQSPEKYEKNFYAEGELPGTSVSDKFSRVRIVWLRL